MADRSPYDPEPTLTGAAGSLVRAENALGAATMRYQAASADLVAELDGSATPDLPIFVARFEVAEQEWRERSSDHGAALRLFKRALWRGLGRCIECGGEGLLRDDHAAVLCARHFARAEAGVEDAERATDEERRMLAWPG